MELTIETIEANAKRLHDLFQAALRAKISEDKTFAEEAAGVIVYQLVEEVLGEVIGDVHRAIKLGYSNLVFSKIYDHSLDEIDLPFYPENVDSKTGDINCPKCHKLIHASRFAPHLERCMQQGRSSSRIASQRIAKNSKECSYAMGSDEDDEWKIEKTRSGKKFDGKKKKDSVRKQKPYKTEISKSQREGGNLISTNLKDIFHSPNKSLRDNYSSKGSKDQDNEVWISPNKVVPVGDDKVHILSSRCGVKSNHTGKYCGRSLRCPLHSDFERAVARKLLAGESMNIDVEDDYFKNVSGSFSRFIPPIDAPPDIPPMDAPDPYIPPMDAPNLYIPPMDAPDPYIPPMDAPDTYIPPMDAPDLYIPPMDAPDPYIPPMDAPDPYIPSKKKEKQKHGMSKY